MDDRELVAFLQRKVDNALNDEQGDISDVRQNNFREYYGMPYGDEEAGHSQFVTREVFEAIEWAMPSLLRVFTGNDRAVEFEPLNEQDEEQAQHETDIVNYYVNRKNNGFLNTYTWTKDVLMNPNGYLKCWVEEKRVVKHDFYSGVTMLTLQEFQEHPEYEITEATGYPQTIEDPETGQPIPVELYDIKVKKVSVERILNIRTVPADEVLVDDNLYSVDLDQASFVCHRVQKTASDLIEEGYDEDEVLSLGVVDDETWNDERTQRLFYEEESPDSDEDEDGPLRQYWVHECWAKVDYDDDNIAEMRHIVFIGDTIFINEETGYQPLISASAIIIPHKHIGMSYAEAVSSLQLVGTVLTRQLLDNIYAHNDKRHFIDENWMLSDNSTMDDYLDSRSTAIVGQGPPSQHIMPETTSPIVGEILQTIEHFEEKTQMRTGVSPQLTLDPSVLKDSTMGAFMGALENASQRLELLVRVMAETGFRVLYKKVHYLMRQFVNSDISLKIRGAWVDANPSQWAARDEVLVNVGLGHSNKQIKLALLSQLLEQQKEFMGSGMVTVDKIYNTLEKIVDQMDLGAVSNFYIRPGSPEFQEPPPPEPSIQEQALMIQAQTFQQREANRDAELQLRSQKEAQDMRAEFFRLREELALQRQKADTERQEALARIQKIERELNYEGAKTVSDVRNTNADTVKKGAETTKILSEADKDAAEAFRTQVEASDEMQVARAVVEQLEYEDEEDTAE